MRLDQEHAASDAIGSPIARFGMAATVVAGLGSWRVDSRLPGRRFIPHAISMGLDNFPVPCTCGKHGRRDGIPDGLTHREKEPCPFEKDNLPKGMFGGCCWLRGKVAVRELEALGESSLRERMFENMTAEEALDFARDLAAAADRLEAAHAGRPDKPNGAPWNGRWDPDKDECVWETYSTFEQALDAIREAARWYEMVGRLGFGVRAWY